MTCCIDGQRTITTVLSNLLNGMVKKQVLKDIKPTRPKIFKPPITKVGRWYNLGTSSRVR